MVIEFYRGLFVPSLFSRFIRKKLPESNQPSIGDASSQQPETSDSIEQIVLIEDSGPDTTKSLPPLETSQLQVGYAQSVGIQRDSNEDSLFTHTTNLISNGRTINLGLYVIADGMGGHENGELASSIAVRKLSAYVINTFFIPSLSSIDQQLDISLQEVLRDGVMSAHQAIKLAAIGGGTTLTAALVVGDQITIAHVGDSRAYAIDHTGHHQLLTHDHSLVKRLEEIGQITAEEASVHPKRNLLYRALGQGDQLEPDITSFSTHDWSKLILCTDGLWGVVPENEFLHIIASTTDPQIACEILIMSANSNGGPDNISVIMIQFPG